MLIGSAELDQRCPPPIACFGKREAEKAAAESDFGWRRPATATGCERFRRKHSGEAQASRNVACYVSDKTAQDARNPAGSNFRGEMRSGFGGGRRAEH